VAEQFTGTPGVYVPIDETIRGFKEILEGKHDDLPERAFFMKGTIDEVVKEAQGSEGSDEDAKDSEDSDNESTGSDEERESSGSGEERESSGSGEDSEGGAQSRAEETSGEPGTAG
jgi:hypothetical protein